MSGHKGPKRRANARVSIRNSGITANLRHQPRKVRVVLVFVAAAFQDQKSK
jgi:hypothetical protein